MNLLIPALAGLPPDRETVAHPNALLLKHRDDVGLNAGGNPPAFADSPCVGEIRLYNIYVPIYEQIFKKLYSPTAEAGIGLHLEEQEPVGDKTELPVGNLYGKIPSSLSPCPVVRI